MWEHQVFVPLYTFSLIGFFIHCFEMFICVKLQCLVFLCLFFFIWSKNMFADLQLRPWTTLSAFVVCHAESFPSA